MILPRSKHILTIFLVLKLNLSANYWTLQAIKCTGGRRKAKKLREFENLSLCLS